MEVKPSFQLPQMSDPVEHEKFRKNTVVLATKMANAVEEYLDEVKDTPELCPNTSSIGAACYLVSYIIGVNCDDVRKEQIAKSLMTTLMMNDETFKLATIPLDTNKPM